MKKTKFHDLHPAEQLHDFEIMLLAVKNLPRPNMVRIVQLHEQNKWQDFPPVSWRNLMDRDPKRLESFAQHAAHLLLLGIVVLDEEGIALTDAVSVDHDSVTHVDVHLTASE